MILKRELRKKILSERKKISSELKDTYDQKIKSFFLELESVKNADVIHSYVEMEVNNEIKTSEIITSLIDSAKRVLIPVSDFETNTMISHDISCLSELSLSEKNILEPKSPKPYYGKIDVVIVPLLAVDYEGNRLGYGGGFYDRFLRHTDALKVALVYSNFIFEKLPSENHDIPVDLIISEIGIRQIK